MRRLIFFACFVCNVGKYARDLYEHQPGPNTMMGHSDSRLHRGIALPNHLEALRLALFSHLAMKQTPLRIRRIVRRKPSQLALEPLPTDLEHDHRVIKMLHWYENRSGIKEEHVVTEIDHDQRLVDFAASNICSLRSKKQAKIAIKRGSLCLNGAEVETSRRVSKGDVVTLQQTPLLRPGIKTLRVLTRELAKLQRQGLHVVHEDSDVAVVWKPGSVHVKRNKFFDQVALEDVLPAMLQPPPVESSLLLPMAMHRLDWAVTGLCLVAKTNVAVVSLGRQFQEHILNKTYSALLAGTVPDYQGIITLPVDDKSAETEVLPLYSIPHAEWGHMSAVRLRPRTGRTHQLRIHAAKGLGCPVVGDSLYWEAAAESRHNYGLEPLPPFRKMRKGGVFLEACGLEFIHPNGTRIEISIPESRKFGKLSESLLKKYIHRQNESGSVEAEELGSDDGSDTSSLARND